MDGGVGGRSVGSRRSLVGGSLPTGGSTPMLLLLPPAGGSIASSSTTTSIETNQSST